MIARRAFEATGLTIDDDPRFLAVALGLRVFRAPMMSCGGESTIPGIIAYSPRLSGRKQRIAIAHGVAHTLLSRERWAHTETDAWLLTPLLTRYRLAL